MARISEIQMRQMTEKHTAEAIETMVLFFTPPPPEMLEQIDARKSVLETEEEVLKIKKTANDDVLSDFYNRKSIIDKAINDYEQVGKQVESAIVQRQMEMRILDDYIKLHKRYSAIISTDLDDITDSQ